MSSELISICFDAEDPGGQEVFWAAMLAGAESRFGVTFRAARVPKIGLNLMHLELTSTSSADQLETVAKVLRLGGRHIDIGQDPADGHVVLADPGGNEFDVIGPGNEFLAGCGFLGAVSCDGTRAVGLFWSRVLGWPLVWDQGEETAIQHPDGGPKITWGGPPLNPKNGRVHFEVAVAAGVDRAAEVERLLSLGATQVEPEVFLDPDGDRFRLLDSGR
ncbi:VOC family protein [Actinoplanes derwentensis]|uniref:Glyoxalase-like domain-containing protein n=1 Tax=Actinoplanes derwentensis TaxID=113562 RepID=A0A1H1WYT7_9ACTN|nr:VOC family protein [Actinoplanes derwentensis]GID85775.1 hypothetical protein Ade03nite_46990 [Actinoplanes derwentensis]SDT02318.1 hypothetical protein SAMN04489716_2282 [Actinoplanes derwentensis]